MAQRGGTFSHGHCLGFSVVLTESRLTFSWFCYCFKILCIQHILLLSAPRTVRNWENEKRKREKPILGYYSGQWVYSHWRHSEKLHRPNSELSQSGTGKLRWLSTISCPLLVGVLRVYSMYFQVEPA